MIPESILKVMRTYFEIGKVYKKEMSGSRKIEHKIRNPDDSQFKSCILSKSDGL
jgi:hypothetical protein